MRITIFTLFWLYVLAIGADNLSTFEALHHLAGAGAYEANPVAAWGMGNIGMVSYLIINSIISLFGLYWVAYGSFFGFGLKCRIFWLGIATAARLSASLSNFYIIHLLGG